MRNPRRIQGETQKCLSSRAGASLGIAASARVSPHRGPGVWSERILSVHTPAGNKVGCLEERDSGQGVGCFSRGPCPELDGNHRGQVWPAPTILPEMGTKETGPLGSLFWLGRLHSTEVWGETENNDWKESCLQPALPFTWLGRWGTF